MRFDELPNELIVMLSKRCDPFTRDQIRTSNKRIKNVIDKHFQWKPCLESLSLELAPDGEQMSRIRVRTCTVYGQQEEQIRLFRHSQSKAKILSESLAKVTSVRRLHLSGIQIDEAVLRVLIKEFEKMGYLCDLVLEECAIELGKTQMSHLVTNMNLKCIRIIRCTGAYRIVDDTFIKGASEEFILEGMVAGNNAPRYPRLNDNRADEDPDYDVTIEEVNRQLQEANAEMVRFEEENRPQEGAARLRHNFLLHRQQREQRRLRILRRQLLMRDRVPQFQHAQHFAQLQGLGSRRNVGHRDGIDPQDARRQLEDIRRQRLHEQEDDHPAEAPAFVDQGPGPQPLQERQLRRAVLRGGMAQAPGQAAVQHQALLPGMEGQGIRDQRYLFITKRILNFLREHPLPRFELRNLNANVNVTLTTVVELIKKAVKKDKVMYWNFGNLLFTHIGDLEVLSKIPNIVWSPKPTWVLGFASRGSTHKTFEMKTTDRKKTFIFGTNIS